MSGIPSREVGTSGSETTDEAEEWDAYLNGSTIRLLLDDPEDILESLEFEATGQREPFVPPINNGAYFPIVAKVWFDIIDEASGWD